MWKTTLLKVLGMIDKQTDGTVCFMGKDTSKLYTGMSWLIFGVSRLVSCSKTSILWTACL